MGLGPAQTHHHLAQLRLPSSFCILRARQKRQSISLGEEISSEQYWTHVTKKRPLRAELELNHKLKTNPHFIIHFKSVLPKNKKKKSKGKRKSHSQTYRSHSEPQLCSRCSLSIASVSTVRFLGLQWDHKREFFAQRRRFSVPGALV